jgi:uncharacterized protein YceK
MMRVILVSLCVTLLSACGTFKVHNPNPQAEVYSPDHGINARP